MSENCVLLKEIKSQEEWGSTSHLTNEVLFLPTNPSAYPFGVKDLCESKINILCGTPSQPCSG